MSLETRYKEIEPNVAPARRTTITLPLADFLTKPGSEVRLGVHTDTLLAILQFFGTIEDNSDLTIEGRILTPTQESQLMDHPIFKFFLSGRDNRSTRMFLESLSNSRHSHVMTMPFTPGSLANEIGHQVGFYSIPSLVNKWQLSGNPNQFIPLFGGCNQFQIGSDQLGYQQLENIAFCLNTYIEDRLNFNQPSLIQPNWSSRYIAPKLNAQINSYKHNLLNNFRY